ncbi:hypothetical protein AGR4C_pa60089 [Agrobacterium tumefaciens str. Kerr 14]|uniref:Uncharacterized protein n=1 Tax=Agrobacterium tumefaciens str. Kerr 14 TaxID=1183424 RepID=A0A1S7SC41_AGRTU|nr:hypothetical protein AGR4C_pa60089 [Agrobacterium tumefaciens str. Kerr 14]
MSYEERIRSQPFSNIHNKMVSQGPVVDCEKLRRTVREHGERLSFAQYGVSSHADHGRQAKYSQITGN